MKIYFKIAQRLYIWFNDLFNHVLDDSEIGTRDVCGDMPGMRMDENDHMMLRSGSPTGVQNFLKKLRFEM